MEISVSINYTWSPEASGRVGPEVPGVRIPTPPDMGLIPQKGDLISLEVWMPEVFMVVHRHFHWVDVKTLQVDVLLGLP